MSPEQANLLLDRISDALACSDLRMYAWARRRDLEERRAAPKSIAYARNIENSMSAFADEAHQKVRKLVLDLADGKPPKAEPIDKPKSNSSLLERNKQAAEELQRILAEDEVDTSLLISSAAAGFVVSSWRDTIEPWHYFFTDAQMSWMSVATTRDVLPFIDIQKNRMSPKAMAVLTNPNREVLPGVSAKDAFGPAWAEIADRIRKRITEERELAFGPSAFIHHASLVCPRWWGCYGWYEVAWTAASALQLGPRQTRLLLEAPHRLSFRTWERVIRLIHEH